MERATILTALIFIWIASLSICANVRAINSPSAIEVQPWQLLARHRKPTKLTTKIPLPNKTTLIAPTLDDDGNDDSDSNDNSDKQREHYHPAAVAKPRLIERYDKRSLDGHYEYRYVLSNGDVRYERAYWQPVGHTKVLARKGFYSYPLPNHRFHTVYYTADHNGYREEESSYTRQQPVLPRSLTITVTDAVSEKPASDKDKDDDENKITRKPNWTPVTTTILQKGRIGAPLATQETRIGAETKTQTKTKSRTELNNTKALMTGDAMKTSALDITNRPQINIEDVGVTAKNEVPEIITQVSRRAISSPTRNEAINPIKTENVVQMATMATEPEQPQAIDTTTVLSVD